MRILRILSSNLSRGDEFLILFFRLYFSSYLLGRFSITLNQLSLSTESLVLFIHSNDSLVAPHQDYTISPTIPAASNSGAPSPSYLSAAVITFDYVSPSVLCIPLDLPFSFITFGLFALGFTCFIFFTSLAWAVLSQESHPNFTPLVQALPVVAYL